MDATHRIDGCSCLAHRAPHATTPFHDESRRGGNLDPGHAGGRIRLHDVQSVHFVSARIDEEQLATEARTINDVRCHLDVCAPLAAPENEGQQHPKHAGSSAHCPTPESCC